MSFQKTRINCFFQLDYFYNLFMKFYMRGLSKSLNLNLCFKDELMCYGFETT